MNKLLLPITFVLLSFSSFSQDFGIGIKDHPFYDIIEWKGKGGLLRSQNPKVEMKQINLTLVGDDEEGMWDQKFNPKVRTPLYLFNEGTRYVYFLDHLDLIDNGRTTFNQINAAGNVKSKVLDIGNKIKRMEGNPEYNKFKGVDAAVTEKTLIYHYRLYHKKEKEYQDYVAMMTHHNLIHLTFALGSVDAEDIKSGEGGVWKYAGFEGDVVYFARRRFKAGLHGWTVKGFSSKGIAAEDHFIAKPENLMMFQNIGYGNLGAYYVTDEKQLTMESGLISYMNGEFYLTAIIERNGGSDLVLLQADGSEWIEINAVTLDPVNKDEDEVRLGTFPLKEGITYHYKHQGVDKVGILHFEKGKIGKEEPFTEQSVYNPSALLLDHSSIEFVTQAPNGKIVVCDKTQFGRSSSGISFQHR